MRTYPRQATQAAFELGGIGTGNVSLGARGELRDWELNNRPGLGVQLPYSFFAIRIAGAGPEPIARVLEGQFVPPYPGANGFGPGRMAGLPRFARSELSVRYPFATVRLSDPAMPLPITLEAFTPFIPLDALSSGLPAAVLRYRVDNPTEREVEVSIAGSLGSPIGVVGWERFGGPIYAGQPSRPSSVMPPGPR